MSNTSAGGERDPIDTTGDPELEARWQAVVREVIDAKAAIAEARHACVAAERERGPLPDATPEALAKVSAAHEAYNKAVERLAEASRRMKAGDI